MFESERLKSDRIDSLQFIKCMNVQENLRKEKKNQLTDLCY